MTGPTREKSTPGLLRCVAEPCGYCVTRAGCAPPRPRGTHCLRRARDRLRGASYDEIRKNLINLASERNAALGGGTDYALAQTVSGTPHVGLSDLSVRHLLAANIALRRAEYAQVMNSSEVPTDYVNRKAQWGTSNDIRAFGIDAMSPDDLKNMFTSLTPAERARFNNSLGQAYAMGLIARPAPAPQAPAAVPTMTPGAMMPIPVPPPTRRPDRSRVLSSPW
jgi:hypothetical protein